MKIRSLSRQAIVAVVLIEFLGVAIFAGTALWHERQTRLEALDATIRGRADSLIGAVQDAEDPAANILVDPAEFAAPPPDVYAVYNPDGRLVGSSQYAPPAVVTRTREGFHDVTLNGRRYRVLQRDALRIIDREETHGVGLRRPMTLIYAVTADHVWHEIMEAVRFYILLSLGLVCTTVLVFIVLVRRLFRPIRELATRAEEVTIHSPAFRAPESAIGIIELRPLADALSGTVARLRHAFEQEKRFVRDATHELKTAVAVVRSTIQVLTMRQRSADEYELGLQKVLVDNERVEELVSRMLTLARYQDSHDAKISPLDLSATATTVLERLLNVAEARSVRLHLETTPQCMVALPEEAAEILISNLVVNAIQHSARQAEVHVLVSRADQNVIFAVEDGGAGISAEILPFVFERFFRVDPSRSRATGGAGLGLAICKSIVEGAGGRITLESQQGKGTTVTVFFRLA